MGKYFRENMVSTELEMRIWGFFQSNHYALRKRVHKDDINMLQILPAFLLRNLYDEVFMPVIVAHPFLFQYSTVDPSTVSDVCQSAVNERCVLAKQELFSKGHEAT